MMRVLFLVVLVFSAFSGDSWGRDTRHMFPIQEALQLPTAKEKLNRGVKFFFGDQQHPAAARRLGRFTSNRKSSAFGKSDLEACQRAFLSALISLQDRALKEGGDAVVNIHSYYKKHDVSSTTQFECGAGNVIAGVALRGTVVKLGGTKSNAARKKLEEF